jgi:hypothetical protein
MRAERTVGIGSSTRDRVQAYLVFMIGSNPDTALDIS